ncbi:MAG: hypothetical protein Kow00121_30370 [Elainellaceae cyanobacterium]
MRIRQAIVTLHHPESNGSEERTVTILLSDRNERYVIFIVELGRSYVIDLETNTVLIPD